MLLSCRSADGTDPLVVKVRALLWALALPFACHHKSVCYLTLLIQLIRAMSGPSINPHLLLRVKNVRACTSIMVTRKVSGFQLWKKSFKHSRWLKILALVNGKNTWCSLLLFEWVLKQCSHVQVTVTVFWMSVLKTMCGFEIREKSSKSWNLFNQRR